ncbi:hypothetical protein FQA39_LY09451 [Lamprigera yunnana]|nr:hypothetical protein FQA39_LY09451 [Lamprigera yunnana]
MANYNEKKFVKKQNCINVRTCNDVRDLIKDIARTHEDEPFYIFNINDLFLKYDLWKKVFPRIEPHYAVKCNHYDLVLRVLAALGVNFDCATKFEMQRVLALEVDPSRIVYAHTTKLPTFLKYAKQNNIDLVTFDNEEELYKMKEIVPNARTLIRIKYDGPAMTKFGEKFGCDPYFEAENLLQIAKKINVNVVGVSFHVGTGSRDALTFYQAIKTARNVFDYAANLGYTFNILDIGGGYPGINEDSIIPFAKYINMALDDYFLDKSVRIIAEPGRFFVESAFTLACSVHSMKKKCGEYKSLNNDAIYEYYLTDGIHGNMGSAIPYNVKFIPVPLNVISNLIFEFYMITIILGIQEPERIFKYNLGTHM